MQKLILATGVVASLFLFSCRKPNLTAGPMTSEDRTVGNFDELQVDGSMEVFITDDSTYEVRVEAGERLIQYIETDVVNGRLKVYERNNRVIRDRDVRVYVSATALEYIELDGSGDISGSNIAGTDMEIHLDGSGDIDLNVISTDIKVVLDGSGDVELDGYADTVDFELQGSGDLDGRWLEAQDAVVFLDGSGDLRVWSTNSLEATLYGSGNISYWGMPTTVNTTINGSGEINEM